RSEFGEGGSPRNHCPPPSELTRLWRPQGQKRGGRKGSPAPRPSPGLAEARRRGRAKKLSQVSEQELVTNLQDLDLETESEIPSGTGLVLDERMGSFRCPWDDSFPERPERLQAVQQQLSRDCLLERCIPIEAQPATPQELQLVHSQEYVDLMSSTPDMTQMERRALSDTYDSVYLHPNSFPCALLATGALLRLVDALMGGDIRNGLALVRPPGHHAQRDSMNGYCMFNNVAIAARYAQKKHHVPRVLIVDWDVHHGQGTQFIFEQDPSVLYFSVHRYEQGRFWPHLKASDWRATGNGKGQGYTVNVPWNQVGMRDGDYISSFLHVLLPIALEVMEPVGDPLNRRGEMAVTPGGFAHLTHLLMSLAKGRLILSLEGGSLVPSRVVPLQTLLGDPCPLLETPCIPCPMPDLEMLGKPLDQGLPMAMNRTGLVYDARMMEHFNMWDSHHPERPERIAHIAQRHLELGLTPRCVPRPPAEEYIDRIRATSRLKPRDLHREGENYNSIYLSSQSFACAQLAAGAACRLVEAILTGEVHNGLAIVRPPGHHAERDAACGFCFFNSVAVAARHAQDMVGRALRILIVDWDIHHGNGTQHIFEEDPSVLYVSLHRYDHGTFFPMAEDAASKCVGRGRGEGFTVNVAWNGPRLGDSDYLSAMHHIVMPIAYEFNPELVLVSAGFDAARGDPLGGCLVSPEGYAHMTHLLMGLAGGHVALVLEGGYNLSSISDSMAACTRTLLGDPPPLFPWLRPPLPGTFVTLAEVAQVHQKYWQCLRLTGEPSFGRGCGGVGGIGSDRLSPPVVLTIGPKLEEQPPSPTSEETLGLESLRLGTHVSGEPEAEPTVSKEEDHEDPGLLGEAAGGGTPMVGDEFAAEGVSLSVPSPSDGGGGDHTPRWTSGSSPSGTTFQTVFYAVTPLAWCPHLMTVRSVPEGGLDATQACQDCGTHMENWLCLSCYQVHCGRYIQAHMLQHHEASGHPVVLSYADLSVWCYACQAYVNHEVLTEAKNTAYLSKFGEEMPGVL
uniref:Protein deacetylase HDAC6 n=1 Tax=Sarcophilus harrisii TaxID=9305 RepID=G3VDB1_SARHA